MVCYTPAHGNPFPHRQNVNIEGHAFVTLQNQAGVVMEVHEYENAYYQVKDDVLTSLPAESEEEVIPA
ncbi:hypothetical protein GCM10007984_33000 [Shewanella putrefaciens]|uniref:Uncharacterized protein n=2 Tax=Shewanella putrefaciens TaxID=24 RepID=E6XQG9_SHEP2|nr:hypothetical protein Sputw3181_1624 [Shewanella sp. W3-18-1]GGN28915.1 hypothetical protein GCM10007984_33000 [Shewanella putrefaciens]CAD6364089.1 hypothetical protein SHEWT2_01913 [Shewanella hafniensis]SUI50757.1 Uncharacterised protein [Shewanella putrefaciens]